jgi:hypothetical protein
MNRAFPLEVDACKRVTRKNQGDGAEVTGYLLGNLLQAR